ncbi:NB-ARC domain-containing protein [Streptomyces lutosisoli]|uniref:NB-ARC domain-containing protein n=1 Tax=Streptomyces lutosisoli TaxID=2665721 RepID=A0ABW2VEW9_9ACTN
MPEPPVPFVGRDGEVARLAEQLSFGRSPVSRSKVVVLHGPPGVGKSALAAEVARAVAGSRGRRVHWISVGDTPSAETAILRLLAEHAAPRREIVEAALMDDREFSERLRRQCAENIRGSVIVLDDVGPEYGLSLVQALGPGLNQVIITSRHESRCGDANAYLHAVRPLDAQDALQLVKHLSRAEPEDGIRSAENEFVSAAQGLPALLRIAGLILRPPFTPPRLAVNTTAALVALAWDRLDVAEKDLLQRLAVWGPGGPFTLRSVEALLWENGRQAEAQRILDGLARYGLVHEVREGAFSLPSPLVDAVLPLMSGYELSRLKGRVRTDLLAAARDAAWDTAGLHDRATGFWHLRAEKRAGIGYAGIGTAPAPVSAITMRGVEEPYPHDVLDHRFVSVDASEVYVRGSGRAGAHSDHLRPESAHLLLSLADHSR